MKLTRRKFIKDTGIIFGGLFFGLGTKKVMANDNYLKDITIMFNRIKNDYILNVTETDFKDAYYHTIILYLDRHGRYQRKNL